MSTPADNLEQAAPERIGEARRLLARIQREFGTAEETVAVGARSMRFTRVADPEAVLDAVCEAEALREQGVAPKRELRMPYWAAVWESAQALADHLAARDVVSSLSGVRALDLGCGMGMAGAAMALLGARVTLADIDTAGLMFARLNTLPWADRCRVTRCDWTVDDLGERYDLIVGADVLYDVSQWEPVEAFCRRHLAEGGTLLLGEPSRPKAERYPDWLTARGWTVAETALAAGEKTVRVFEARR